MRKILIAGESAVAVTWDAEEISGWLENLFAPWHGPRDTVEYTISIERDSADYRVTLPGVISLRVESAMLVATLAQLINNLAGEIMRDHPQIHAAALDFNGTGVIISGSQGSGKTTLALTALSSGATALTDEVTVLGADCRTVTGFPRPFRVREGTRALQPPVIPGDCPRMVSSDGITHVFTAPGLNYYRPETRASFLLFPSWRPGKTEVRELSEREALVRLLPQGFNFHLRPDGCLSDTLALIRNTRAVEFRYSDHWHAIHVLKEMIS